MHQKCHHHYRQVLYQPVPCQQAPVFLHLLLMAFQRSMDGNLSLGMGIYPKVFLPSQVLQFDFIFIIVNGTYLHIVVFYGMLYGVTWMSFDGISKYLDCWDGTCASMLYADERWLLRLA